MQNVDAKSEWEAYVAHEKARIMPFLAQRGIRLDEDQPQTIGERYLTRPVGGGRKIVLFGRTNDRRRVVIKTSDETKGKEELELEQDVRQMLTRLRFAYEVFSLPEVLWSNVENGILVTEYVEQDKPFLERPLEEQFTIALSAFKAQEAAHITTAGHELSVADYYIKAGEYKKIGEYAQDIVGMLYDDTGLSARLDPFLDRTIELIRDNEKTLDRYGGFLTHWDFIPQNFRIRDGRLYLLDLTSMRFGNKYEGWARFINFMTLYNPALADALLAYVRLNRTPEESLDLKIMRAYRLVELLRYYAAWLHKTGGTTRELARARIAFWTEVLEAVLGDREVPSATIEAYKAKRDALRTTDEKRRQAGLH